VAQWLNNSFVEADYDALILTALAMDAAKSTNPVVADPWLAKITTAGSGKTVVYTYAEGLAALKAGKQIQYVGASGPIAFDKWHNSYGNQAMQTVSSTGQPLTTKVFTAAQIEALG
jgi:branched-chain amino acid transport system substrate-binding protein